MFGPEHLKDRLRVIGPGQLPAGGINAHIDQALGPRQDRFGHALQRDLHVIDPHRQRGPAPGFAIAKRLEPVKADPGDRNQPGVKP